MRDRVVHQQEDAVLSLAVMILICRSTAERWSWTLSRNYLRA